jgi:ABC-type polar amino acid transport system ATPase subunit
MSSLLEARGLVKQLGGRRIVDGVDLHCEAGQIVGLLGPNGAGKTTTLRMLYGFLRPDAGRIRVDGVELARDLVRAKRSIGVCTQDDTFDGDFTVVQNLVVAASYFRPRPRDLDRRVPALLERFDLGRYADESVSGSASYHGGLTWDVTASSTLSLSRNVLGPREETTASSQDLSLTLRLPASLTAVPTLSYGQERDGWSGERSDTRAVAVTLSHAPPARGWSASTHASYTTTRASDGSIDGRSVGVTTALTAALGRWLPRRSTVSVEATWDRYVDGVVPQSSSHAVAGFVLLRLAGF